MRRKTILSVSLAASFCLTAQRLSPGSTLDSEIASAWSFAQTQLNNAASALPNFTTYPTVGSGSSWQTSGTNFWEAGFFPGELWSTYQHTGNTAYQTSAANWSNGLVAPNIPTDHDIGFVTISTWGQAVSLGATQSYRDNAKANIIANAATLAARYRPQMGLIDSWDGLEESPHASWGVAIDTMMNLQLLFQAHQLDPTQTNDYNVAVSHATTAAAQFVRSDGSTYHIVRHYDTTAQASQVGTILQKNTRQGFDNESTWSRGQAWALYGFTTAYNYTQNDPSVNSQLFLTNAKANADYFIANLPANLPHNSANYIPGDYVPPSDFNAEYGAPNGPWEDANANSIYNETNSGVYKGRTYTNDKYNGIGTYTLRDTSAAAVAASGLLELCTLVSDPADKLRYFNASSNILNSLLATNTGNPLTNYLAQGSNSYSLLVDGSSYWNATNQPLIYGDYYLLEAMNRYASVESQFVPEPASCAAGLLMSAAPMLIRRRGRRA